MSYQKYTLSIWGVTVMFTSVTGAVVFVASPPCSYSFFSYCHDWKEIANCSPHLRSGKLNTPFLEGRVYACIVWSCPHGRFITSPPFICFFNHSCTSTWIHIYFILWVIIQYTSLLSLFLIFFLVLGTINSHNGLPCPFDVSPSLCACVCVCEVLRLILYSSCLSSTRISHFSQHLQLLVLENGIRNQDLGAKHSWILT